MKSKARPIKTREIVILGFLTITCLVLQLNSHMYRTYMQEHGKLAQAIVTDRISPIYVATIVEYNVNGKTLRAGLSESEPHVVGDVITILYDPENYTEVMEYGTPYPFFYIIVALFLGTLSILGIIFKNKDTSASLEMPQQAVQEKKLLVLIQHPNAAFLERAYDELVMSRQELKETLGLSDISVLRGGAEFCLSQLKTTPRSHPVLVIVDKETYATYGQKFMDDGATIVYKFAGNTASDLAIYFTRCVRHFFLNESLK